VDRNFPFRPPGGFLWVDGTGRCKITEQKGRSYLNMLTRTRATLRSNGDARQTAEMMRLSMATAPSMRSENQ
jgi:hypothetical protein